jgi:hypothetical protein
MAKPVVISFGMLLLTGVLIALALQHTSATISDKMYLLLNEAFAAVALFLIALLAFVAYRLKWRSILNYSLLAALCAVLVVIIPSTICSRRISRTETELADLYSRLTHQGPPFPSREEAVASINDADSLISHGYWVASDRSTFEVYYHIASDSYTMAYPVGRWEWRGNKYQGPTQQP